MSPSFDEFQRRYARAASAPTLTVTTRGALNFNEPALVALGKPEAVVLMYARDEAVIGLRPASRDEENAYRISASGKDGTTRTIVAKDFCAWIGADLSEARRYPLTVEDGIGCVRLRGPVKVVTGNRKGGPRRKNGGNQ